MKSFRQSIRIALLLWLSLLGAMDAAQAAVDSKGTELVFAFPPNYNNSGNLTLFITGEEDAQGTVEVATTEHTVQRAEYVPVATLLDEFDAWLAGGGTADAVTLALNEEGEANRVYRPAPVVVERLRRGVAVDHHQVLMFFFGNFLGLLPHNADQFAGVVLGDAELCMHHGAFAGR